MIRTFVDSNVLIAAAREKVPDNEQALKLLVDPAREFASSVFVQLEVLPKAKYNGRVEEYRFYQGYFAAVKYWAQDLKAVAEQALEEGARLGLSAADALHIAAAASVRSDELVTLETPERPIHRTSLVDVIWIRRL